MFHIVLFEPEIPPNTGNIIRLCANCGAQLHLIEPLGFELSDRQVKRAGLDYHQLANVQQHASLAACWQVIQPKRVYGCSTKGRKSYTEVEYQSGDVFLFGPETRGLPQGVLDTLGQEHVIRIPMLAGSRSLNLSNAVAIIVYEAWRQLGFEMPG
ncbi:MAG: tRNA (uridine(34)/cytosine(34)/5-carboxymethylaminomethyluridine(34)-2'-O)-methyltransferase TrmL [Gammaproteobacteria bacterium]|nr:tRNA (uridine(34)/cytosine(34)/5-carboxymethylaminomethyluridine(34)-2'-O)-methyltransferase TrmL [Gammaproteobacteria bacterium]